MFTAILRASSLAEQLGGRASAAPHQAACGRETSSRARSSGLTVLVTAIVVVQLVSAWTNLALKRVRGAVQVLAVVGGLACRLEVMKAFDSAPVWLPAGRCFVGQSVLGCEKVDRD